MPTRPEFGDPRLPASFWRRVRVSESGCWEWAGARTANGYGRLRPGGRHVYAHRFAYEGLVGPIPEGLSLDHLCRVRHCIRPGHTEATTHRTNVRRGIGPTAVNARKTHCSRGGHPLFGDNLYVNPRGERNCRICKADNDRRYAAARSAR